MDTKIIAARPMYAGRANGPQRLMDRIAGVPPQRTRGTTQAVPTTINPENNIARERVFNLVLSTSDSEAVNYVIFDAIGLVANNNGSAITSQAFDNGSTFGSGDVSAIVKQLAAYAPIRLSRLRVTMPSSVTTIPGTIQLVKSDFTGSVDPIPLDATANYNPFYDQGNVIDYQDLDFLIDAYRGIVVRFNQTTAVENYTFTFYLSQLGNNYNMRNL